jgi:hypothetical protein
LLAAFGAPPMRVVARMHEPLEAERRSDAEAVSPVGWRRAFEEMIGDARRRRQKAQSWLLATMAVVTLVVTLFFVALKLFALML